MRGLSSLWLLTLAGLAICPALVLSRADLVVPAPPVVANGVLYAIETES